MHSHRVYGVIAVDPKQTLPGCICKGAHLHGCKQVSGAAAPASHADAQLQVHGLARRYLALQEFIEACPKFA